MPKTFEVPGFEVPRIDVTATNIKALRPLLRQVTKLGGKVQGYPPSNPQTWMIRSKNGEIGLTKIKEMLDNKGAACSLIVGDRHI